jgi:hypothetical protein
LANETRRECLCQLKWWLEPMLYKDFLNSARKHKFACDVIHEKVSSIQPPSELYRSLILTLYYLSGYTIECIVKYAIYDLYRHNRKTEIDQLDHDGVTYADIKHHKFNRYTEFLNRRVSGSIPLINDISHIPKAIMFLYNEWDAHIRYRCSYHDHIATSDYIDFYMYSKRIFHSILEQTRG